MTNSCVLCLDDLGGVGGCGTLVLNGVCIFAGDGSVADRGLDSGEFQKSTRQGLSRLRKRAEFEEAGQKAMAQGLNRLRKKAYSRRKSVKSMPQGLKATFISCHLYRG